MYNDGIDFSETERESVEKLRAVPPGADEAAGSA
jgi:hypothetical protein